MIAAGGVAFYTVSDARFFVGTVALLNSLRLSGHDDPVVVLDAGLEAGQRRRLEPVATMLEIPGAYHPSLAKWVAPLERPAAIAVLLDSDIFVVSSLAPLLEDAARGRVVAFVDRYHDRFHPEWARAVGVESLRRRPYVNGGCFVLPRSVASSVLPRLRDLQLTIDPRQAYRNGGSAVGPWRFPDQDSWNAVLAAEIADDELSILERELAPAPFFEGLRLVDPQTLECRYDDGRRPYLLHHWKDKPWHTRTYLEPNPFTMLLPRLTLEDDLTVRLRRSELPFRFRGPLRGRAERYGYAVRFRARRRTERLRAAFARGS